MLKAFFNQLRYLADHDEGLFHKHIERRIGDKASPELEAELKEAILLLPGIVSRVSILWAQLKEHSRVKEVGSYFIAYMYNPKDFIPEDDANGLFGYLYDAYLASLVYDLLTEELMHAGESFSKEDEQLRKKLVGAKKKIKSVIYEEATEIQKMIGEILVGEDATFTALFVVAEKRKEK